MASRKKAAASADRPGHDAVRGEDEQEWREDALRGLPQPIPGLLAPDLSVTAVPEARTQRLVALSQVLALRAQQHLRYGQPYEGPPETGVISLDTFRQRYLPRQRVLAPDAIANWVARQAARDGAPSLYLTGIPVAPEEVTWDVESGDLILGREGAPLRLHGLRRGSPTPGTLDDVPSYGYRWLCYCTPEWPHARERVRAGGVLDQLRWLALALTNFTMWTPEQACAFILTGLIPIAVDYAALLERRRGRRPPKEMTTKHLVLAVYTETHREQSLKQRMAAWNAQWASAQPEWKPYETEQRFGGDSNLAVRRLMGDKVLDEDRTHRGPKPPVPHVPPLEERGGAAVWRS